MIIEILIEQVNVSDDQYQLAELHATSGDEIQIGDRILSYESSKAIFDYEAHEKGYVYFNPKMEVGEYYEVGYKMGVISNKRLNNSMLLKEFGLSKHESHVREEKKITKKH